MAPLMITELVLEIIQSIILAWVLTRFAAGLVARTVAAGAIGVAVGISTNGSYWNWWGFPTDYTLASVVIQVVGYTVAGLVAAFVLGFRNKTSA
jgi:hypothetical protein